MLLMASPAQKEHYNLKTKIAASGNQNQGQNDLFKTTDQIDTISYVDTYSKGNKNMLTLN